MAELIDNLKTLIALCVMFAAIVAALAVAYDVGKTNGQRSVARHIPEIRRLERINALAPKTRD